MRIRCYTMKMLHGKILNLGKKIMFSWIQLAIHCDVNVCNANYVCRAQTTDKYKRSKVAR